MENEKKYETISLDLSKFEIDSKDISEFVSKNTVETLVNIVTEAAYKDNELKVLQEIIKKIEQNSIPKDKIREKIETLKKEAIDRLNEGRENIFVTKMLIIDILEELLEGE